MTSTPPALNTRRRVNLQLQIDRAQENVTSGTSTPLNDPFKRSQKLSHSPKKFSFDVDQSTSRDSFDASEITKLSEYSLERFSDNAQNSLRLLSLNEADVTIVEQNIPHPDTSQIQDPPEEKHIMANNITIRVASEENRPVATPKFVSPSTFNPSHSNTITFLASYERAAIANGWNDAHKINYFGSFLESPANFWYEKFVTEATHADYTWNQIRDIFKEKYGGDGASRIAKTKFQNRKQQPHETIRAYYFDLMSLAHEVDANMCDETFRQQFEAGITPELFPFYCVLAQNNMTKSMILEAVYKLENISARNSIDRLTQQTALLTLEQQNTLKSTFEPRATKNRSDERKPDYDRKFRAPFRQERFERPYCTKCGQYGHSSVKCYYSFRPAQPINYNARYSGPINYKPRHQRWNNSNTFRPDSAPPAPFSYSGQLRRPVERRRDDFIANRQTYFQTPRLQHPNYNGGRRNHNPQLVASHRS